MIKFNELCHINKFEEFRDFILPCEITDIRKGDIENESIFVSVFYNGDINVSMNDEGSYEIDFEFTTEEIIRIINFIKNTPEYKKCLRSQDREGR